MLYLYPISHVHAQFREKFAKIQVAPASEPFQNNLRQQNNNIKDEKYEIIAHKIQEFNGERIQNCDTPL